MKLFRFTSSILLFLALLGLADNVHAANLSTTACPGNGCVNIATTDKGSVSIQITGTWSGTLVFEATVDGTTYKLLPVSPQDSTDGELVTSTASNNIYLANAAARVRVQVRFSVYNSGTAVVTLKSSAATQSSIANVTGGGGGGGGAVTQSGTWTMQPGNTANTTAWLVTGTNGNFPIKDVKDSTNTTVLDTTNHAVKVIGTAGGANPVRYSSLTNTAVQVSSGAAILDSIVCLNSAAAISYVQFFDTASPTVGSTAPTISVGIEAGKQLVMPDANFGFITAIYVAATTGAANNTAPGTALNCNFGTR